MFDNSWNKVSFEKLDADVFFVQVNSAVYEAVSTELAYTIVIKDVDDYVHKDAYYINNQYVKLANTNVIKPIEWAAHGAYFYNLYVNVWVKAAGQFDLNVIVFYKEPKK